MTDKLMKCFANPVKSKLLIEIIKQGQATARGLAEAHGDIPQATLYRYLKKMTGDGLIKVIEEKQVRNVTEKVYAIAIDYQTEVNRMLEENSGEAYLQMFQQFILGLLQEFQEYSLKKDIDILNDGSGFASFAFYATDEELTALAVQLNEVIQPYAENKPAPGRKMRMLARIITPPKALR